MIRFLALRSSRDLVLLPLSVSVGAPLHGDFGTRFLSRINIQNLAHGI